MSHDDTPNRLRVHTDSSQEVGSTPRPHKRRLLGGIVKSSLVIAVVGSLAAMGSQSYPVPNEAQDADVFDLAQALADLDVEQEQHRAEVSARVAAGFTALAAKNEADRVEAERLEMKRVEVERVALEELAAVEAARVAAEQARVAALDAAAKTTTTAPSPPITVMETSTAPVETTLPPPPLSAPPSSPTYSVWDALAQCESGGNWSINTGNGYYGGLQFSYATWIDMGGGIYAEYPHQATREQQINIGQRLQTQSGWGQWPGCASSLGLL